MFPILEAAMMHVAHWGDVQMQWITSINSLFFQQGFHLCLLWLAEPLRRSWSLHLADVFTVAKLLSDLYDGELSIEIKCYLYIFHI